MPADKLPQHARFLALWPTWELSRQALADRLGVKVSTINNWVQGLKKEQDNV